MLRQKFWNFIFEMYYNLKFSFLEVRDYLYQVADTKWGRFKHLQKNSYFHLIHFVFQILFLLADFQHDVTSHGTVLPL